MQDSIVRPIAFMLSQSVVPKRDVQGMAMPVAGSVCSSPTLPQ